MMLIKPAQLTSMVTKMILEDNLAVPQIMIEVHFHEWVHEQAEYVC
jgi:hypothetical protein